MVRRGLLTLLMSSFLLSCGDATDPGEAVTGTWHLETVEGMALPYVLSESSGFMEELTSEVLILDSSGDLTIVTGLRYTEGTGVTTEVIPDGGTYTVNGSTITITWESDGSTSTATVDGDVMTLEDIGLTFVYRRG
jgi:hypothetical protein